MRITSWWLVFAAVLVWVSPKTAQGACSLQLDPGGNVAAAMSSAPAGSIICLNSGNHGTVDLVGISKTPAIVLQSTTGIGATVSINLSSNHGITFQSLTVDGLMWSNGSNTNTSISILNNRFTNQLYIYGTGNAAPQHNLVDGNTFDGISVCANCREGRLSIYGGNDLVVSNNHFGGGGESDGIQWGGYGGTVGPGNVFEGLVQANYARHIDAIQMYGEVDHQAIVGNCFNNDTVYVGAYDRGTNITLAYNVFGLGNGQIQLLGVEGAAFTHNTVQSTFGILQGAKAGDPTTKNIVYQDNLFVGVTISDGGGDQHGCATGCIYDHNLFSQSTLARGTNTVIGLPTYVGGPQPPTCMGFQLTSSSLGHQAATDGTDLGARLNGASGGTLLAPARLKIL